MKRLAGVTHGPRFEDQRESCGDGVQTRFATEVLRCARMIPLKNHNICIFNESSKFLSALSAWFPWSWDKSPPFWVNGETVTWREKATPG